MKNKFILLFVILFHTGYQSAFAARSCEDPSLPIKLSDLQFAGVDFNQARQSVITGSATCSVIEGMRSDNQTNIKNKSCQFAAINPGNIYFLTDDKKKVAQAYSSTENKLGYYFCANMNEQKMCNLRKAELSKKGLEVSWRQQPGTSHYNSGDCLCKKAGTSGAGGVCPADEDKLDAMANTTPCKDPTAESKDGKCVCKIGGDIASEGKACPTESPVANSETKANVDDDLSPCMHELYEAKSNCTSKSRDAVEKCDKEAPDNHKNVSQAQRILEHGLDALIAKNAGTGALDSCIKMGAAGTILIKGLSLLRDTCKKEVKDCKKVCDEAEDLIKKPDQEFVKDCREKFKEGQKSFSAAHEERLLELVKESRDVSELSANYCKSNATKLEGDVDAFFDDMNNNVAKANICQCQLTTGVDSQNCQDIIGPAGCMTNPNQPGCAYSTVACTPVSTNPACKIALGGAGSAGPSGFAMPVGSGGPGFSSLSGGGGVTGNGGSNKLDLGSFADEARPTASATAQADLGSPFGNGSGGGAGGGGGGGLANSLSGGGSGDSSSNASGDNEKNGLSGLFNTARNGIASLFGGGVNSKSKNVKAGSKSKMFGNDVNAFRPKKAVRGLADVSNEFGSKNRDIWKAMNDCYNSQYQTFITVESPTK